MFCEVRKKENSRIEQIPASGSFTNSVEQRDVQKKLSISQSLFFGKK